MKVFQVMIVTRGYYGSDYRLKAAYSDKKQAKAVCADLNKRAKQNEYIILTLNVIEPNE